MVAITCLLWGDNPSEGFMVTLSPKDTVYDLKQKITEMLELSVGISRKLRLIKLNEYVTLDDKRLLKKETDPKEIFVSEELDKPFQIIENFFINNLTDVNEFPLDIIACINENYLKNDSPQNTPKLSSQQQQQQQVIEIIEKEKEKEVILTAAHKPVAVPVIRESTKVQNNYTDDIIIDKNKIIDPSLFPSPPKQNLPSTELDNDIDIIPRAKSIIFNIDRFPTPPTTSVQGNEEIINVKTVQARSSISKNDNEINRSNNINNPITADLASTAVLPKDKNVVYDVNQFPNAPKNENSVSSITPLVSVYSDAPPSYDVISKADPNNNNQLRNDNNNNTQIVENSNTNSSHSSQSHIFKKDIYKMRRFTTLKGVCLCIGVMISTFLAVLIGKILIDKTNENQPKLKTKVVGFATVITTDTGNGPTTSLNLRTSTIIKPEQTYQVEKYIVNNENNSLKVESQYNTKEKTLLKWEIEKLNEPCVKLLINDLNPSEKDKNDIFDKREKDTNENGNEDIENEYIEDEGIDNEELDDIYENDINGVENNNLGVINENDFNGLENNNFGEFNENDYNEMDNNEMDNNGMDKNNLGEINENDLNGMENDNLVDINENNFNEEENNNLDEINENDNLNNYFNEFNHKVPPFIEDMKNKKYYNNKRENIPPPPVYDFLDDDNGFNLENNFKNNSNLFDLNFKLLRIVEVNEKVNSANSESFITFSSQFKEGLTVYNVIKQKEAMVYELKMEYEKEKIIENKVYMDKVVILFKTSSHSIKDESNLILSPSVVRCYLIIKQWNNKYRNSKLQVEIEVQSSSGIMWPNSRTGSISTGIGQTNIIYSEKISENFLILDNTENFFANSNNSKIIRFNIETPIVNNQVNQQPVIIGRQVAYSIWADLFVYELNKDFEKSPAIKRKTLNTWILSLISILCILKFIYA